MDVASASAARYSRLSPAASAWRSGARDRRNGERRAERVRIVNSYTLEPPPPGPDMGFMAHVLSQSLPANAAGFTIYAATRAPRYACGICADERF